MANTLQIKRSTGSSAPSSLSAGELAYAQGSDKLFIGHSDGSTILTIGGAGAFLRSDTNDTFSGNLTITGTLTVQGTTTTIESNTLTVGDNIIVLNNDVTGDPSQDAGIEIERGNSDNALIGWKEDGDIFEFKVGSSAGSIGTVANITASGNLSVDGVSNLDNTDVDGTLVVDGSNISLDSTSTLNIDNSNTSNGITIGTATSGVPISIGHTTSETTVNDNLTVTGTITASSTISVATALVPDASGGADLGTASLEFNDAFFNDGAVINFGNDQDTTLTHTDGTGLTLNSTNKLCFNDPSQFIQGISATVLGLGATDEIDLTATAIDINGTCDISGNATFGGNMTITASGKTLSGYTSGTSTLDKFVIDGGTF
tara:strand:- start:1227 stop:2345 length:1119 start_codon:yes stop_codon:yes gene_type:complete